MKKFIEIELDEKEVAIVLSKDAWNRVLEMIKASPLYEPDFALYREIDWIPVKGQLCRCGHEKYQHYESYAECQAYCIEDCPEFEAVDN